MQDILIGEAAEGFWDTTSCWANGLMGCVGHPYPVKCMGLGQWVNGSTANGLME